MYNLRFSVLVTAFITFVSFCAARTVITNVNCNTLYCGRPIGKVPTATTTVRKTTPYLVTRTSTIIKHAKTVSVDDPIWVRKTVTLAQSTITDIKTVWIGTSTHTRMTTTTAPSYTETAPITTLTLTPSTVLAPIPSGVVGVNQDPDNKAAQTVRKRDPEPEPAIAANKPQQYPSVVRCTKTLLTKTGTKDVSKTITKTTGTRTIKVPRTYTTTTTVTGKNVRVITVTESHFKVAFTSGTRTVFTPATWYQTTVTTSVPTPTYYQACGYRNRSPPPELQLKYWSADQVRWRHDEPTIWYTGYGDAYECCVSCWTLPASRGKCVGSIWTYIGPWGPPPCDWEHDENCQWPDMETGGCRLILEIEKGVCRQEPYYLTGPTFAILPVVVSNGPGCLRWKFSGTNPPFWP